MLSGSKPTLDGSLEAPGLGAAVTVERDRLGIPTIRATTRADLAYALGLTRTRRIDSSRWTSLAGSLLASCLEMFGAVRYRAGHEGAAVPIPLSRSGKSSPKRPRDQRAALEGVYTRRECGH